MLHYTGLTVENKSINIKLGIKSGESVTYGVCYCAALLYSYFHIKKKIKCEKYFENALINKHMNN